MDSQRSWQDTGFMDPEDYTPLGASSIKTQSMYKYKYKIELGLKRPSFIHFIIPSP
jgi:hypothetical protein